jgi:hypothetical protein
MNFRKSLRRTFWLKIKIHLIEAIKFDLNYMKYSIEPILNIYPQNV